MKHSLVLNGACLDVVLAPKLFELSTEDSEPGSEDCFF